MDTLLYSLSLGYAVIIIGVAILVMGITLPLIIQESRVSNGLIGFRRLLLQSGWSLFILALSAFIILAIRFIFSLEYVRYLSFVLLDIFSTFILISILTTRKIYTFNFSHEEKEFHRKKALEEEKKTWKQ